MVGKTTARTQNEESGRKQYLTDNPIIVHSLNAMRKRIPAQSAPPPRSCTIYNGCGRTREPPDLLSAFHLQPIKVGPRYHENNMLILKPALVPHFFQLTDKDGMLLDNDSNSDNDTKEDHNKENDISCDSITQQHNRHNRYHSPLSTQQLSSYLAFSALFPAIQNRGRIILLLLGCASTRRYPESARGIVMSQVARVLWERG
ncbi:hypothetical protein WJX79_005348 [Trebouxia sp. C0005]